MSYIETGSLDIKDMDDFQRVEDNLVYTLEKGTNKSEYSDELKAIFLDIFKNYPHTEKDRTRVISKILKQLVLDHFDSVAHEVEEELSDEEFLPSLRLEIENERRSINNRNI